MSFRFTVSIRARHVNADSSELAQDLLLKTKTAWAKGDSPTTRSGFKRIPREEFYWCSESFSGPGEEFARCLNELVVKLEGSSALDHFLDTGGKVEVFVGLFLLGPSAGLVLDWGTMHRLAVRRVSVSFDIFGNDT